MTLAMREHEQQRLYEDWLRYRNAAEIPMPSSHWNVTASDAFCIVCEHGNVIASINGLRLGAVVPMSAPKKTPAPIRTPVPPTPPPLSNPPSSMLSRAFASSMANGGPPVAPPPEPMVSNSSSSAVVWHTIPWVEINAAFGQVALLLSTLEQSLRHDPQHPLFRYQLLCRGSTSQIGLRPGKTSTTASTTWYNLFYSEEGTFHLLLFAKKRNFDTALQCLLSCVEEARTMVQARDRTVVLPYAMSMKGGGTIAGLPVAFFTAGGTNPETWTRAMKYLLTNLKHLLSFRGMGLWNQDHTTNATTPAVVDR
jgi:Apg6 BARA domain